jgi:hypothetical protein
MIPDLYHLTEDQRKEILKAVEKAEGGIDNLALMAGFMTGLAFTERYRLDQDDRIFIAKAGEYLRRVVCEGSQYGEKP